jgi:hypothetical protein
MSKRKVAQITGGAGDGRRAAQRKSGPLMRGGQYYSTPRKRGGYVSFRSTGEIKSIDSSSLTTANPWGVITISSTTSITLLNGTSPGAAFWNRIGRKVHWQSIQFNAVLALINATARSSDEDYCKIALVWDRQCNGAPPIYSDMFQDTDAGGASTSWAGSHRNLNNAKRFTVLREWQWFLPPMNVTNTGFVTVASSPMPAIPYTMDFYKKCNLETQYKADTGLIGDISSGGLFLVCVSSNPSNGSCFTLQGECRLRFLDN